MRKTEYLKQLSGDIERWSVKGLIDRALGERLLGDAHAHYGRADGINPVLPGMAVLAVALGILTLIAANWSGMNAIVRLALTFGLLGLTLMLAGDLRARGKLLWSDLAATVGAVLFGGGLVVIGQLYHSEATTSGFLALWTVGAVAVSLLLFSPRAAALAGALSIGWTIAHFSENPDVIGGLTIGPLWVLPIWVVLAWRAISAQAMGLVHLLIIGVVVWIAPPVYDLTGALGTSEFQRHLAFVMVWVGAALIAELVARATPFWSARTISGWMVWIASVGVVSLAVADRVQPHFFTPLDLPIASLAIFSALTAYGAAPGRRWLRGAGIAGFIATAIIFFTMVDDMIMAGLTLIVFGVLLIGLLLVTNRMLARAGRVNPSVGELS